MMLGEVVARRRRRRALRDARLRDPLGVHRRPDGRTHARVPRQEDRRAEMKLVDALPPRHADRRARLRRRRRAAEHGRGRLDLQPRRARAHARSSTRTRRRRTTTARRSPASPATPTGSTRRSALAMLVGRFFLIVLVLAHRRRARAASSPSRHRRHVPDRHAAVRRPPRRRDPHRRRPHLLPGARARPDRGAPAAVTTKTADVPVRARDRPATAALDGRSAKLDPRHVVRNPVMFVVEVGSVVVTVLFVKDFGGASAQENVFAGLDRRSGSGSPCCSPTSPRRWPRAAARRRPTTLRKTRAETARPEAARRRLDRRGAERRSSSPATSSSSRPAR